ncbi:MAG: hypothetical protein ACRCTQ_05705 [Brevinemataceae bacterium]
MSEKLPESVINAKEKGQKVISVVSDNGEKFYFKKPNSIDIAYFQDQIAKSNTGHSIVQEKFLRTLYLGNDAVGFDQYLKDKPLVISKLLFEICANLGAEENFTIEEI